MHSSSNKYNYKSKYNNKKNATYNLSIIFIIYKWK